MRKTFTIAFGMFAWLILSAGGQEIDYGKAEYFNSCGVCHGAEGRGDGPLADELRTRPADLTVLSRMNGGEFPYWKVYALIDGRFIVPGHGSREMPVWGGEFLPGDVATYGPGGGEAATRERIQALAAYVAALQR